MKTSNRKLSFFFLALQATSLLGMKKAIEKVSLQLSSDNQEDVIFSVKKKGKLFSSLSKKMQYSWNPKKNCLRIKTTKNSPKKTIVQQIFLPRETFNFVSGNLEILKSSCQEPKTNFFTLLTMIKRLKNKIEQEVRSGNSFGCSVPPLFCRENEIEIETRKKLKEFGFETEKQTKKQGKKNFLFFALEMTIPIISFKDIISPESEKNCFGTFKKYQVEVEVEYINK